MAISNDERREVAKKLRELPSDVYEVEGQWKTEGISTDCHDQTDYYLIHDVLLECLPAEYMHPGDYEELHERLADLIDRPTCTIVNSWQEITPGLGELDLSDMCGFELSCGHEVNGYEKPHYCSECGAVVVDED